jgi:N utilization substance protein B
MPKNKESSAQGKDRDGATVGARRRGREAALQALYLSDVCRQPLEDWPEKAWSEEPLTPKTRVFANHLAAGVLASIQEIDPLLQKYAENWELTRMAAIDRCILRLATFEILRDPLTPLNVIINEAVEIAKKYSTAESSKFVNGILDKIKKERV